MGALQAFPVGALLPLVGAVRLIKFYWLFVPWTGLEEIKWRLINRMASGSADAPVGAAGLPLGELCRSAIQPLSLVICLNSLGGVGEPQWRL